MMQRWGRFLTLVTTLVVAVWSIAAVRPQDVLAQAGPNRAALVVRFSDGHVQTACISFDAPAISGAELLTRSGLQAIIDYNSGLGGAVCSIERYGCAYPGQDCFCQCQGIRCEYWAYYHWVDGGWHYSQVGASSYQVTDGALEGWSWGAGDFSSGTAPPQIAFTDICQESAPLSSEDSHAGSGFLWGSVAHAQETSATNTAMTEAASSQADGNALSSDYMTYLLYAGGLAGVCVWVLRRRKGALLLQRTKE